jgi:glycerol-3-phosphate cytidylyltransferase-like family protein
MVQLVQQVPKDRRVNKETPAVQQVLPEQQVRRVQLEQVQPVHLVLQGQQGQLDRRDLQEYEAELVRQDSGYPVLREQQVPLA